MRLLPFFFQLLPGFFGRPGTLVHRIKINFTHHLDFNILNFRFIEISSSVPWKQSLQHPAQAATITSGSAMTCRLRGNIGRLFFVFVRFTGLFLTGFSFFLTETVLFRTGCFLGGLNLSTVNFPNHIKPDRFFFNRLFHFAHDAHPVARRSFTALHLQIPETSDSLFHDEYHPRKLFQAFRAYSADSAFRILFLHSGQN